VKSRQSNAGFDEALRVLTEFAQGSRTKGTETWGSQPGGSRIINYVSGIVFVVGLVITGVLCAPLLEARPGLAVLTGLAGLVIDSAVASSIRIAAQWERGVVFRLGRFLGVRGPGIYLIIPLFDQVRMVDMRVRAVNIDKQQVITKDNVPMSIDGVLFYKGEEAEHAVIRVQDHRQAIQLNARASLRDVIGQYTLDQVLTEQEAIGRSIQDAAGKETKEWGLIVTGLKLLELEVPEDLKKMMSRQASAEREKRATITKAEGDREAADNLSLAARTMAASPGAMQLRTLQTIDGLGPTASNTVVLAVPINIMDAINQINEWMKDEQRDPAK